MARAILEGVACNSRWLLKYVERFIGRRLDALTIIGGGANSDLWCQIHADVLDRPIRQAEQPQLAGARGAALQAAVALGYLTWEQIPDRVPIARTFEPDPAGRRVHDAQFDVFVELYKRNRTLHARLNR
jgi:xylulokinase